MSSPLPSLEQMTDILDIKPIIQVSLLWFWILLFVLFVTFSLWLYYFIKRRLNPKEKPKPQPLLNPREIALRDLEELDLSDILERGQYRKYYFRLSEIIRLFLQDEIRLPAVDTTSEEIIPYLQSSELLKPEEKMLMSQMLLDMDLVKFARFLPSREEVSELRAKIKHFINTAHVMVSELKKSDQSESKELTLSEQSESKGGADVSS